MRVAAPRQLTRVRTPPSRASRPLAARRAPRQGDESDRRGDLEASICGSILTDLLNERMAPNQPQAAAPAGEDGEAAAPATDGAAARAPPSEQQPHAGAPTGVAIAEDPSRGEGDGEVPSRPLPAHVLAEASRGRANVAPAAADADVPEHAGGASGPPVRPPSDAQLLAVLGPLVPPVDSAEFADVRLKPLRRALVEQLGPAAKLTNEALGKLVNQLVEQRKAGC